MGNESFKMEKLHDTDLFQKYELKPTVCVYGTNFDNISTHTTVSTTVSTTGSAAVKIAVKRKYQKGINNSNDCKKGTASNDNGVAFSDEDVPPKKRNKQRMMKVKEPISETKETTISIQNVYSSIVTSTPKSNLETGRTYNNLDNLSPIHENDIVSSNTCSETAINGIEQACNLKPTVLNATNNANETENDVLECDDSVQIIEGPIVPCERRIASVRPTDDSVIILNDENDSDVEITYGPSTSTPILRRALRRKNRNRNRTGNKKHELPGIVVNVESSEALDVIEENDSQEQLLDKARHNCPICLCSLYNTEISSTTCGHVFCTRCISTVVKTSKSCPTCRKKLTKTKIHPIFI